MPDLSALILSTIAKKNYQPLNSRSLARKMGLDGSREFQKALLTLLREGKVEIGKNKTIRPSQNAPMVVGTFKRLAKGDGIVRVESEEGLPPQEFFVPDHWAHDASNGDKVQIAIRRRSSRAENGMGEITNVVRRSTRQFVGTYFERDGSGFVRVDGQIFTHSIAVADARVKGARANDKVVLEMIRFPTPMERGEGAIIEVIGKTGDPKVDTTAVVRALGIPDEFSEEVLEEARQQSRNFNEANLNGRIDFTQQLVISIDPVDAKDFDDAVSLTKDSKTGHWLLTVHIADVSAFVTLGGPLDREARLRGTSVYLPQRVIPMFPEVISNGIASLQEGKIRYVKTVEIEFTADGQKVSSQFSNGVIKNRKRFTYEEVQEIFETQSAKSSDEITQMLFEMRKLSRILRERRKQRGALEMSMPEAVLEYDEEGHVSGAHFAVNDESHQLIEDFMLSANEAVAEHFDQHEIPYLRRIHPAPDERKLEAFAEFVKTLKYKFVKRPSRFDMQKILEVTAEKPERHSINYAMLRSLKQAKYSPEKDEHFALASNHYCHFTSPIRRYPDLVIHRMLNQWIEKKKVKMDFKELKSIGDHCSQTERRAENAEREAVKMRLLLYLSEKLGTIMDAVITGVAEYGFFAQGKTFPAEGLVHVSSLADDYYSYDPDAHALEGNRHQKQYRLGDSVKVEVVRVDLQRKQLDFRIADRPKVKKKHVPA